MSDPVREFRSKIRRVSTLSLRRYVDATRAALKSDVTWLRGKTLSTWVKVAIAERELAAR